jgi:hypothetical protein
MLALKDQVMVTGAAKTANAKDGRVFKVGAADSALLRSLLSHAADDASSFVLVSPDKDVPYAFKAWKRESPVLYANIADAAKAVFPAVPQTPSFKQHVLHSCQ